MDGTLNFQALLETADTALSGGLTTLQEFLNYALSIELPVPDVALLCACALVIFAVRSGTRDVIGGSREQIEEVYQNELLTANRRAQQARAELQSARKEIERERQKRRREARGEFRGQPRPRSQVVELKRTSSKPVRQSNG